MTLFNAGPGLSRGSKTRCGTCRLWSFWLTSQSAISTQLQHQKNMLVASIGRLKNPTAHPLQFSEQQRRQIRSTLRPGDVLLTYTAGMTSNLFIPGNFKHAALFVGTAESAVKRASMHNGCSRSQVRITSDCLMCSAQRPLLVVKLPTLWRRSPKVCS